MNVCLTTSTISLSLSMIFIIVSIATNIIGLISYRRALLKNQNDQAMIFGVKNGYTDEQLIEECKRNKIKYPRDTVAFYRYYYQMKDKL